MKEIVVLSGAGVSAESGIKTFRDNGGLWEGHDVMDVASPEGWAKDPKLVLDFYNMRRKDASLAKPNEAHKIIAHLEHYFKVKVITQNVDNLHEQAGSTRVCHLHGELFQSRSSCDPSLIYTMHSNELNLGDLCEKGSQLRPNIVWFGEAVPMLDQAIQWTLKADIFIVVGTSLQVYPAAGLLEYVAPHIAKFIVDPHKPQVEPQLNMHFIEKKASEGMKIVRDKLMDNFHPNM